MNLVSHLRLLAQYNQWMNGNLYEAAASLPVDAISSDKGAFFGSILGTLNHIAVGDTLWMKRFALHPACKSALQSLADMPAPTRLDQILFADLPALRAYRERLDGMIIQLADDLDEAALAENLTYTNTTGVQSTRNLHALLVHFFNHQTHHRGQVTTLLFQAGVDPGVTDLLISIPQED